MVLKNPGKTSKTGKDRSYSRGQNSHGVSASHKTAQHKASETFKALFIALLAALILRQFVIASYNVPTGSMKDTILIGDFMFVNKFIYGARTPIWVGIPFTEVGFYLPKSLHFQSPSISEPKVKDIIVFDYPQDRKTDYIKRCVAAGGQTVEVKDKTLYVDGKPEGILTPLGQKFDPIDRQNMEYTLVTMGEGKVYQIRHFTRPPHSYRTDFGPETVPQGHYFMMGDNRDNSQDSRVWKYVPRDHIVGKPLMIWLSWNDQQVPAYRFYDSIRWERLGMVLR
jgi:signal peptidase I